MSISSDIIIRAPIFIEKKEVKDVEEKKQQLSLFSSASQSNRFNNYCPETYFFGEPLPDVWDANENDFTRNKQNFQFHSRNRNTDFSVKGTITENFSLEDVLFCLLAGVILSVIMFGSLFLFIGAVL